MVVAMKQTKHTCRWGGRFQPIAFIRYRGERNQWERLPFKGAHCTGCGNYFNRDGSAPTLPIQKPVVVVGKMSRCPCCNGWLDSTPGTAVLYPNGNAPHVPHFLPRCNHCGMVGQVTSCIKHGAPVELSEETKQVLRRAGLVLAVSPQKRK